MGATCTSEIFVCFRKATWCYVPEGCHLYPKVIHGNLSARSLLDKNPVEKIMCSLKTEWMKWIKQGIG
jgi:hypothetical protein